MDVVQLIGQSQGGQGFAVLGRQVGLSEADARAAVEQLAPYVMSGMRRNSRSADGVSSFIGALASGGHARYLDGDEANITDDGNAILGHVFGSKDVSRAVALQASEQSGISSALLKKMLPIVAAMIMSALAKNMMGGRQTAPQSGGGLGDILGQVLGGGTPGGPSGSGGFGDILGQVLGGGAAGGGGGSGGLGDILGQVLGGGGSPAGGRTGQPDINDVLGSIFGGNASPEVRATATRKANDVLGGMLGGGTARGTAADSFLDAMTRGIQGIR
jgi:hypothetical protein